MAFLTTSSTVHPARRICRLQRLPFMAEASSGSGHSLPNSDVSVESALWCFADFPFLPHTFG